MKKLILFLLPIIFLAHAGAQSDSTPPTKWYHPDYAKLQFAGEIGFLSAGVGSEIFKNRKGEIDLMLGYLPKSIGGDNITTFAVKFAWIPWEKPVLNNKFKLQPLTLGAILFRALGEDLNKLRDRDIYPRGYYWWSSGLRIGPVLGIRLKRDFKEECKIKSMAFYTEFTTNDLFIYSWGVNSGIIPLRAIFAASFGVKLNF